jgi:hypothetical protein
MWPLWTILALGGTFIAVNALQKGDGLRGSQATANGPVFGVSSNYLSLNGVSDSGFIGADNKPAGYVRTVRDVPMTTNAYLNMRGQSQFGFGSSQQRQSNAFADFLSMLGVRTLRSDSYIAQSAALIRGAQNDALNAQRAATERAQQATNNQSLAQTQQSIGDQIAAFFQMIAPNPTQPPSLDLGSLSLPVFEQPMQQIQWTPPANYDPPAPWSVPEAPSEAPAWSEPPPPSYYNPPPAWSEPPPSYYNPPPAWSEPPPPVYATAPFIDVAPPTPQPDTVYGVGGGGFDKGGDGGGSYSLE